ncbi:DUF1501 domain-containing protein [Ralstonia pseudosolanacearum]|uniref:DUF1501 domain-containing protein n=1 Tax=Ralstonia pseudosolanacearum TaxID=1310165 RepID=UPI002674A83B|nr:DUF1501 domain-containing protein [Ralstonia pseudosolanacearum]MDO3562898.1 DUF1501 domain-containing protein [Ralstonia pseudosolanacearum]MDO3572312.1 DUF1501 domain-containing protein [Ralstonia pseudosolanacearum]
MERRDFLKAGAMLGMGGALPGVVFAQGRGKRNGYGNLLILIELKGGNDGLNTVVPYTSAQYYALRPRIAIKREQVLQLDDRYGLHPSLQPLMPLWQAGELSVVQGLSYPQPNLSHFRSIEIWDTASRADQYLHEGWLTRAFAARPVPASFGADGVIIGSADLGPLDGGARAVALASPDAFLNEARLAMPSNATGNATLAHVLKVEADIVKAADGLRPKGGKFDFKTRFSETAFGNAIKAAMQVVAAPGRGGSDVAAVCLSLGSFDTHTNQLVAQNNLLRQLGDGIATLKGALTELGRWDDTLIVTYSEFGRRPRENLNNGTDHGTASAHFVAGGRARGGLAGQGPALERLDGSGNLEPSVDFRSLYATVLERWWGMDSRSVLAGRFAPLDLIKA